MHFDAYRKSPTSAHLHPTRHPIQSRDPINVRTAISPNQALRNAMGHVELTNVVSILIKTDTALISSSRELASWQVRIKPIWCGTYASC